MKILKSTIDHRSNESKHRPQYFMYSDNYAFEGINLSIVILPTSAGSLNSIASEVLSLVSEVFCSTPSELVPSTRLETSCEEGISAIACKDCLSERCLRMNEYVS